MVIMEITEDKISKMAEYAEKMLRYGGRLMECIESLDGKSEAGMRHGMRGYRDMDDDPETMGMRRYRDRDGRYM